MRQRPWPIVVLAILYFLGPVFNTLSGALIMKMSYFEYVSALFRFSNWFDIAVVMFLYPLAGLAIFAIKPWSYPVYLGIMAVSVWGNFQDYRHFSGIFTFPLFLGTTLLNVGLVSYFLIPAVRAAYFDRRLRWWEAKPRYEVNVPGVLQQLGQESSMKCTVLNVSGGGAFIKTAKKLDTAKNYRIRFSLLEQEISVDARIAHRLWKGTRGYGLEFIHDHASRKHLSRVSHALGLLGVHSRNGDQNHWESFKSWAKVLFFSGRGWIPELPVPGPVAQVIPLKKKARARGKRNQGDKQAA